MHNALLEQLAGCRCQHRSAPVDILTPCLTTPKQHQLVCNALWLHIDCGCSTTCRQNSRRFPCTKSCKIFQHQKNLEMRAATSRAEIRAKCKRLRVKKLSNLQPKRSSVCEFLLLSPSPSAKKKSCPRFAAELMTRTLKVETLRPLLFDLLKSIEHKKVPTFPIVDYLLWQNLQMEDPSIRET